MAKRRNSLIAFLLVQLLIVVNASFFEPFNVSYDHRALIINGKRRMLISAGIHYPRATPEMWRELIEKSKEGGANVIQTYVFWNGHETVRGQYNFEGRYDLVKFVKLVGASGLYLNLRIGPYVCAEWNFGGFPVWLRDIPGIKFRTDNAPFKEEMEKFVVKIVDLMKQEMLFSWQGGPIILLQIENEYGNVERAYGQGGKNYVSWAAHMAHGLDVGVPWIMCQQNDAPEITIDSCNGFYCDGFKPNSYSKPTFWTENWDGWYAAWGGRLPHRPVQDLAFAVARFFERGGSLMNYYMFFGGTNFGRTSGGPFYTTSYDYDAPIDEYGSLRHPKWGHLKDLHEAIKLCEPSLISVNDPRRLLLGLQQEAHIYQQTGHFMDLDGSAVENENCAAFLANTNQYHEANVEFHGQKYQIPPWSVSILPDCKHVAFNTAKMQSQITFKGWATDGDGLNVESTGVLEHPLFLISDSWGSFQEPIGVWGMDNFTAYGILEHLNVTKDSSDYLWYVTRIYVSDEDALYLEENEAQPFLMIDRARDLIRVFVNGKFEGSAYGHWICVNQSVHLKQGYNEVAILSETVGLQNYGAYFERDGAGMRGPLQLIGLKSGELNLLGSTWTYQVGLKGENMEIYAPETQGNIQWSTSLPSDPTSSPFTWYKTTFDAPGHEDPVALDLGSMGKGLAWVNGHSIGRYWTIVAPEGGCAEHCDYRGTYRESKCLWNCGNPTQRWYHVPRSLLKEKDNLLVIFEEAGGNPLEISMKLHITDTVCASVSEDGYPPLRMWSDPDVMSGNVSIGDIAPELELHCDEGQIISSVIFASYGNPKGSCLKYSQGNCHASNSFSIVSAACEGKNRCAISVSNEEFGEDPCKGTLKSLTVQAKCARVFDASVVTS